MIRPATAGDVPDLAGLERLLFGADAWSAESLADELSAPGRIVTVHDEGRAVGYAVTILAGEVADLARIGVHPGRQRSGIARALLDEALAAARAAGADRMLLEVSSGNAAALAFYAQAGFTQIDSRRRYYRDATDAVVLRRTLEPAHIREIP